MAKSTELTEALSKCIMNYPFYAVLLMDLLTVREVDGPGCPVPTAGTDGKMLYINKKWFGELPIDERVFILCHEVLHVVFRHPARGKYYEEKGIGPDFKPYSHTKMNHAEDYIINDMIIKSGLNAMPDGGLLNPKYGSGDLADEVYCKLKDNPPPPPNKGQGGNGDGNWDTHMPENPDAGDAPGEADVQRALKNAETAAKAQGKMPGHLKRLIDEICEPQVDWAEQLQLEISTAAGRDDSTWARPNRKRMALAPHVYMPGGCSHRAGVIVVMGDTSGSISNKEWAHFFGETASILEELKPEELWVGSCDTRAWGPHLMDSADQLRSYEPEGGGGTHMPAIFDKLEEESIIPATLIILTDGYTDFGEEPAYPVIWGMTTDVKAPFGKNVHIKILGD